MAYKTKTAEKRAELHMMKKFLPETAASFAQLSKDAMEKGALGRKEREYVAPERAHVKSGSPD